MSLLHTYAQTNKNAHNEKPYKISEDQEVISNNIISNNIAPSPEITEIWHYSMQREKTRKKLESNIIEQQNEGLLYNRNFLSLFRKLQTFIIF